MKERFVKLLHMHFAALDGNLVYINVYMSQLCFRDEKTAILSKERVTIVGTSSKELFLLNESRTVEGGGHCVIFPPPTIN